MPEAAPLQTYYSVNSKRTEKLWAELEDLGGKTAPQLLRARSGLFARIHASFTQPVADAEAARDLSATSSSSGGNPARLTAGTTKATGTGTAAKNLGKAAVSRDIDRVYISPKMIAAKLRANNGPARQFSSLLKNGKLKEAEKLLRDHAEDLGLPNRPQVIRWDDGAKHKSMRGSRGKVSAKKRGVIVDDARALAAYKKKRINNVGFTKSTWITAGSMIPEAEGFSNVPQWIKKHKAPGLGIDRTRTAQDPHVTLRSSLNYMDQALDGRSNRLINNAFEKLLVADLRNAIRYHKEKAARETAAQPAGPAQGLRIA